jgi:hypothetical protein
MRYTKKFVETRFNNLKNFCPEIESYSFIDSGLNNTITIGIVDKSGCISNTVNFYTPKEFDCFLDGIQFLNRITNSIEKRSISWSVNDFESVAESLADSYQFDSTKFSLALEKMIYQHDQTVGINTDVIQIYLIDYCQKD